MSSDPITSPPWPARQAGAVAFRVREHVVEILLVRPKSGPPEWLFPKGHLEAEEMLEHCAMRELRQEAGVVGSLVGGIDHVVRFSSKGEDVAVRFFVIACSEKQQPAAAEGREQIWLPVALASEVLTHEDSREALQHAMPIIDAQLVASGRAPSGFRDFLLAEFGHVAASFLKSEEDGERRVVFFLQLAAGAGALIAFVQAKDGYLPNQIYWPVVMVLAGLLLFGLLVLRRVVLRNATTDQYKDRLLRMRKWFIPNEADPRVKYLAFNPFAGNRSRDPPSYWRPMKGGWLDVHTLVCAIVAGALTGALVRTPNWAEESAVSVAGGVVAWVLLIRTIRREMNRQARRDKKHDDEYLSARKQRARQYRMQWD